MRVHYLVAALLVLGIGGASAHAQGQGGPPVVTIVGQNNINVDSQAIQDAVDAATNGTKIVLVGDFQLDGGIYVESKFGWATGASVMVLTSNISISGQKIDNDGDGPANEDPPNGVDDDGDGLLDEDGPDAVLKGVVDGGGAPLPDCGHPNAIAGCTAITADKLYNRGMLFGGDATNVTVSDLQFEGHWRAASPIGELLLTQGNRCSGIVDLGEPQKRITIRDSVFVNNSRGFQIFGSGEQHKFYDNYIDGTGGNWGVLLVGESGGGCLDDFGNVISPIAIGALRQTVVRDNQIEGGLGIGISGTESTTISRNTVVNASAAIMTISTNLLALLDNHVTTNSFLAMNFGGTAQASTALNNFAEGSCFGAYVSPNATGYVMVNNDFRGPCVDVFLDAGTFDNKIIATDFVTRVADLGDNALLGTLAPLDNPNMPEEIQQMLADMRSELGKP